MKTVKIIFLLILLVLITGVAVTLYLEQEQPALRPTLSPFLEQLGKPVKTIDRALSRVLPVSEIDEKMLGEEIKARFEKNTKTDNEEDVKTQKYLNALMQNITQDSRKPFEYKVFLVDGGPNAFSMPGGAVGVTRGLVDLLENEAEMVSILSHEAGHIERGHLFDAVRGELLRRKVQEISVVTFANDVVHFLGTLTFSKAQENESDEFAFRVLVTKEYDLTAVGDSFDKLLSTSKGAKATPSLLGDFFSTHPYLELRAQKFHSLADQWYSKHSDAKMYIGKRNYVEHTPRNEREYSQEFKSIASE